MLEKKLKMFKNFKIQMTRGDYKLQMIRACDVILSTSSPAQGLFNPVMSFKNYLNIEFKRNAGHCPRKSNKNTKYAHAVFINEETDMNHKLHVMI